MQNWKRLLVLAVLGLGLEAYGTDGINLIGIGPVQQGTAGAGVADARDGTWALLNPAGLTDLDRQVDLALQYFAPTRTLRSSTNPSAGTQEDDSAFYIPSIGLVFARENQQAVGFGLYGTSGMGVDYAQPRIGGTPDGQPVRGDRRTELSVVKATLTYAKAFDHGFSIGAGPLLVLSRLRTDILNPLTGRTESDSWDGAAGAGFLLGVNQRISRNVRVGARYLSEQYMEAFDEYDALFVDSFNLPQQVAAGLAYAVHADVELVLDYQWIGWGQLDVLGDQFGWEDQHIVKAGAIWEAGDALTLRTGVSHGTSPIGDEAVFANALFPAIMETHATAGFSWNFDPLVLHAAYTHAFEEERTDSVPGFTRGTRISMYQHSATVGISLPF